MVYPSIQEKVTQAKLILVLYRDPVDRGGSDIFESTEISFTNEQAQKFLRKVTKPCFAELSRLHKQLSQDSLANMHESSDEATRAYRRLTTLEKSRAEIPEGEQAAFEAIEQKIEDCLKTIDEAKQALSDSMFWVEHYLARMRDYLSAYDELLRHLECEKYQPTEADIKEALYMGW